MNLATNNKSINKKFPNTLSELKTKVDEIILKKALAEKVETKQKQLLITPIEYQNERQDFINKHNALKTQYNNSLTTEKEFKSSEELVITDKKYNDLESFIEKKIYLPYGKANSETEKNNLKKLLFYFITDNIDTNDTMEINDIYINARDYPIYDHPNYFLFSLLFNNEYEEDNE